MVFLCGRPGCGRESSATLQIDAPSSTISLVDPRVSRDGVPLCPHHADSTTPPMGWSMNDLRSKNRTLAPVRTLGPRTGEILTGPTTGSRKSGRSPNSVDDERPTRRSTGRDGPRAVEEEPVEDTGDPLTFDVSRQLRSMSVSAAPAEAEHEAATAEGRANTLENGLGRQPRRRGARKNEEDDVPESRPTRRRDSLDEDEADDDKFPWHHHFEDDEPEELQAKSPLLSRAFRSSVG